MFICMDKQNRFKLHNNSKVLCKLRNTGSHWGGAHCIKNFIGVIICKESYFVEESPEVYRYLASFILLAIISVIIEFVQLS